MSKRLLWYAFCLLFMVLSNSRCQCPEPGIGHCEKDDECTGRLCQGTRCACKENRCTPVQCLQKYHCETGFECKEYKCVGDNPPCTKDTDCPQGKKCNTATGICENDENTCASNNDCKDASKICCDLGDGTGKRCNFKKCLNDGDCTTGSASTNTCVERLTTCTAGQKSTCSKGVCECKESCGGDCGSGRCCDAKREICVENPDPCPGVTCPPGFDPPDKAKFTPDPKTCEFATKPVCDCVKKPPLEEGIRGLHSALAIWQGQPVVSGYNRTYGDLMVGFQQADSSVKWEFVDGIPAGKQPTNAPDGPRGGVSEPGDDVGLHTDIAADNTAIHVSYHDATNGTLKYARKDGNTWSVHVVDKNGKGIGRFTSIKLDNGIPLIAYYVLNNGKGQTELRLAKASSAAPKSESDWTLNTVDSVDLPGCKGTCDTAKKESCVEENKQPVCKADTGDCTNKCKAEEVCVNKACVKKIAVDGNDPIDPRGVGLFPSLAVAGGKHYIAYYDQINGDLKLARFDGGQYVTSAVATQGNVGEFPSLVINNAGEFHISYANSDTADIHYLVLDPQLKVTVNEIVDDGIRSGEDRRLSDTALILDSSGVPVIVYQDASVQALMVATRQGPKQWDIKKIVGEDPNLGAFGFFNDHVFFNGKSYISNFNYVLKGSKDTSKIDIRTWP